MKCHKCNSNLKKSPHSKLTGYNSYRCENTDCNSLFDEKDLLKESYQYFPKLITADGIKLTMNVVKKTSGIIEMNCIADKTTTKSYTKKIIKTNNEEIDSFLDGGFSGGKIYSFLTNPARELEKDEIPLIKSILSNLSSDYLIIDPLDQIGRLKNSNIKNYVPKTIEDAYNKILELKDDGLLFIFLNMDVLPSEEDFARTIRMGIHYRVHNLFLKMIATSLPKNSSLLLFSVGKIHPFSPPFKKTPFLEILDTISIESFLINKPELRKEFSLSSRKDRKKKLNI